MPGGRCRLHFLKKQSLTKRKKRIKRGMFFEYSIPRNSWNTLEPLEPHVYIISKDLPYMSRSHRDGRIVLETVWDSCKVNGASEPRLLTLSL